MIYNESHDLLLDQEIIFHSFEPSLWTLLTIPYIQTYAVRVILKSLIILLNIKGTSKNKYSDLHGPGSTTIRFATCQTRRAQLSVVLSLRSGKTIVYTKGTLLYLNKRNSRRYSYIARLFYWMNIWPVKRRKREIKLRVVKRNFRNFT